MSGGLEVLPPELLLQIAEKLNKRDLKQLSLVSKRWHDITLRPLWEAVTVTSESEVQLYRNDAASLPQKHLHLVRELRFDIEFYWYAISGRCSHGDHHWEFVKHGRPETDAELDKMPSFDRLALRTGSTIEQFRDNPLQSFSWGLGACVPPDILGPRGLVTLGHPSLRSLSLITETHCTYKLDAGWCGVDLSAFSQLQSLCWIAPNGAALDTLSSAIQRNSKQLRRLELDFVCWETLQGYLDILSTEGIQPQDWCAKFFGLTIQPSGLIFPVLRELALTDVPIVPAMASAVNFDTLRSLTLLRCLGWDTFLARATELNLPIRLKAFELHIIDATPHDWGRPVVGNFLSSFKGLEHFFIDEPGQEHTLKLWDEITHHQPTLRRFVHHQRTATHDRCSFSSDVVVPTLSLLPDDMLRIQIDPFANQLHNLALEFLGLSCRPTNLAPIVLPFTSKTTLKVLHIRQPVAASLGVGPSWAANGDLLGRHSGIEIPSPPSEIDDVISGRCVETAAASVFRPGLQPEFNDFAEWVFSPQGIRSLQFLVFGDHSFGGRRHDNRLILCRDPAAGGKSNFRILARSDADVPQLDEYRGALRACPTHAFYDHSFGW